MSKKEREEKEDPGRGLPLRPGTAVIMTVPPGMAKRLREREARRKAEREAQEEGPEEKEDGADG